LLVALNHLRISITWAWFLPSPDLLLQVSPAVDKSWLKLFLIFLKIGSVLYGSGYVLLAFLQRELVDKAGLISADQLLDAVAVGQLTPGPLFTTATFIGYVIAGNAGAIAATFGIFLPAFILVALINPWVERLRQSWWVGSFLDGVNAASLGLMAIVAWRLGSDALVDGWTVAIGLLSLVFLLGFKVNSAWLVVMGGAAGWLVAAFL
jgi:chromate transporter